MPFPKLKLGKVLTQAESGIVDDLAKLSPKMFEEEVAKSAAIAERNALQKELGNLPEPSLDLTNQGQEFADKAIESRSNTQGEGFTMNPEGTTEGVYKPNFKLLDKEGTSTPNPFAGKAEEQRFINRTHPNLEESMSSGVPPNNKELMAGREHRIKVLTASENFRNNKATPEDLELLKNSLTKKELSEMGIKSEAPNTNDFNADEITKEIPVSENEAWQEYSSKNKPLNSSDKEINEPLSINVNKSNPFMDESEAARISQEAMPSNSGPWDTYDLSKDELDKLDKSIEKMLDPSLYQRFKNLSTSKKIAIAGGLGLTGYGAAKLMGGGSKQPPVEQGKQVPKAPEKQPEKVNPVEAVAQEQDAVSQEIKKLESEINAPEGSKSFVNKLIQAQGTTLGTDAALKEAQAKRDQERGYNMLGRAADIATGAVYHTGPKMKEFYDQQDKFAERHVEDIKDRIANEKNDPNSSVSKAYNEILGEFGVKAQGLSGAAIEKIAPWVEKKYLAEEGRKARLAELKLKQQELKIKSDDLKGQRQLASDTKRFDQIGKKLASEIASGISGFGRDARTIQSVENARGLLQGKLNYNNLDERQAYELARVLDRILSQGGATIAGTKELNPKTAYSYLQHAMEYITNRRRGAGLGDFIKTTSETLDREHKIATDRIKKTQRKLLSTYIDLKDRDPIKWNNMLAEHNLIDYGSDGNEAPQQSKQQPQTVGKRFIQKSTGKLVEQLPNGKYRIVNE